MHIIAHYGISEGLKNSPLTGMMGMRDEASEVMPLHLAAKGGKSDFIKAVENLPKDKIQSNVINKIFTDNYPITEDKFLSIILNY